MKNFSIGQTVYGMYQGQIYLGKIEDRTWEPGGHVYSVRTSLWREKKWWSEKELSDTKPIIENDEDDEVTGGFHFSDTGDYASALSELD